MALLARLHGLGHGGRGGGQGLQHSGFGLGQGGGQRGGHGVVQGEHGWRKVKDLQGLGQHGAQLGIQAKKKKKKKKKKEKKN